MQGKNGAMREISRVELVKEMKLGWNLGNTMDAMNWGETAWGNPKTTKEMIDFVKAQGFKTFRIPISWDDFLGPAPDFVISAKWMDRVEEVVNYGLENDMYVIINIHHTYGWLVCTYEKQQYVTNEIEKIWSQIAERFKEYGDHLIFESLNEPRLHNHPMEWMGGTDEARDVINQYNAAFVKLIRNSGGNNAERFLLIPTYAASAGDNAMEALIVPNNDDRVIVSIHAYSPYSLVMDMSERSKSNWEDEKDKANVDLLFRQINKFFISKGIPVVIGEFGAVNKDNLEDRVKWASYYVQKAHELGITCVWWDNGKSTPCVRETYGLIDRRKLTVLFPEIIEAMVNAVK